MFLVKNFNTLDWLFFSTNGATFRRIQGVSHEEMKTLKTKASFYFVCKQTKTISVPRREMSNFGFRLFHVKIFKVSKIGHSQSSRKRGRLIIFPVFNEAFF